MRLLGSSLPGGSGRGGGGGGGVGGGGAIGGGEGTGGGGGGGEHLGSAERGVIAAEDREIGRRGAHRSPLSLSLSLFSLSLALGGGGGVWLLPLGGEVTLSRASVLKEKRCGSEPQRMILGVSAPRHHMPRGSV